jgi:3',5'-nucleoside bisphosphate phosphatase
VIDLHSHTTASDGALSPAALVEAAARRGVKTLAVTDHDTIAALGAAREAGARFGVEIIGGVEISATTPEGRSIHVLGYFFDEASPLFLSTIERLGDGRDVRNAEIAKRLQAHGMDVTLEEVEARAEGRVGRPHFAQLLIEKGYVHSFEAAFDLWLADGRPACVERFVISPREAIEVLHRAGGIAVLAHPLSYGRSPDQANTLLRGARGDGADGVEVYYGNHTPGEVAMVASLAARHGLLPAGGADFHAPPWPDAPRVPASALEALRARAASRKLEVAS